MPVYEFKCESCGTIKEIPMHIEERDNDIFCHCTEGGSLMHRSLGCNGFILKGRGWASDGYSKDLQINDKDA